MSLLIGKLKRRAKLSRLPWVQELQEENGIKIGSVMWEIDYGGHTAYIQRLPGAKGMRPIEYGLSCFCPPVSPWWHPLTESRWNLALIGPVITTCRD